MTSVSEGSGMPTSFDPKEKLGHDVTSRKQASHIRTQSTRADVFGIKAPEVRISVDRYTQAEPTAAERTALYNVCTPSVFSGPSTTRPGWPDTSNDARHPEVE